MPAPGRELPPPQRIDTVDVAKAVERLNQLARETARDLHFRVDDLSGRMVIIVINAATQEIVRQIPAEETLSVVRTLNAFGALIDAEI